MHDTCPVCDLRFNREPGYFLGAMYVSYGLALITILMLALLLWLAFHWSIQKTAIWAVILFLPLAPSLTFLARVLWISSIRQLIQNDPAPRFAQNAAPEEVALRI